MRYLKSLIPVLILAVLILVSCTKAGPQGPAGNTGGAGPQGPAGPQGNQGPAGNANVIYSNWTDFNIANWSGSMNEFSLTIRQYPIAETKITNNILDSALVLVYVKFIGIPTPQALPLIDPITIAKPQYLGDELSAGEIIIVFYDINDTNDPGTFGTGNEYRYIIIPGSALARRSSPGPDYKDYQAVCTYYGIQQ